MARYLSSLFSNFLSSTPSASSKPYDSPLFDHESFSPHSSSITSSRLSKSFSSLPTSVRLTSDVVAMSVRSSLRSFNPLSPTKSDCRVLILGSCAELRAKYLSEAKDFPDHHQQINKDKLQQQQEQGGIFWTQDLSCLNTFPTASFDAILCFNIPLLTPSASSSSSLSSSMITQLSNILRPSGAIAGTALFHSHREEEREPSLSSSPSSSSSSSSSSFFSFSSSSYIIPCSIRSFRDHVEHHGFFMHTCVDLSLEGSLAAHVASDIRCEYQDQNISFQTGQLVPARFLATKASLRRHGKGLHIEILPSSTTKPINTALNLTGTKEMTMENQIWNLSMSLSNNLQSLSANYHTRSPTSFSSNSSISFEPIVVTGVSLGLPNGLYPDRSVFDADNFSAIFRGDNFISQLSSSDKQRILEQNVCQVFKKDGKRVKYRLNQDKEVIQVAAKIVNFDLAKEFPFIPPHVVEVLDTTYALAIAAGLEALKDAGIQVVHQRINKEGVRVTEICGLPEEMREDTGVIFASSFPCLDSLTEEVTKSAASKARKQLLQQQAEAAAHAHEAAIPATTSTSATTPRDPAQPEEYEYDRKLLFKLLVMANSQLAELIKARGPNTHVNNACSGTTQAIAIAEDWIKVGRCRRVIVISADHATSDQLLPYLATGFLALGAATVTPDPREASAPFDCRRKGMILGAGAVGMVMETATLATTRAAVAKVEILGTCISNSAFHASLMDAKTTSSALNKFIGQMEEQHNIDRHLISSDLIYFSHETSTHANGGCAKVELDALQIAFGCSKQQLLIANTKGFTGHPMGVGMEDVVAVQCLHTGLIPPIANYQKVDPLLDLMPGQLPLSPNSQHSRKYVLRFAAGFGSQFAYVLYRKWDSEQHYQDEQDYLRSTARSRSEGNSPTPHSPQITNTAFGITGNIPLA